MTVGRADAEKAFVAVRGSLILSDRILPAIVEALSFGANSYLRKPFTPGRGKRVALLVSVAR